ncbi:MAG: PAS domain S-box protein, partial [Verrucomicrobiales bacterium]|nr:PAS domain S-box protein [Verrucomicrobiales bacterium]
MATELPSANMSNDLPGHFLELAPMPIATVEGAAHLVRYVNPAFCQIIGKSADQLLGRSISELLPERDRCLTLIDQVFRTGRTLNHTETDVSEATSLFWSYTMWPVLAGEERVGVMIQVTEITATHATTVEMNEALLLGSLRQHELVEEAANLNQLLQIEITERKKAAKALAEKARLLDLTHDAVIEAGEQFQFMAESMPQKIFTAKPDGEMNYLNQQCKEFTGLSLDRLLGWGWVSCIHPDDLEENVRRWKDSLASGKDFEL